MNLTYSCPTRFLTEESPPVLDALYLQLYSIDHAQGPVPILDSSAPSFEPKQARRIAEKVFAQHGFHPLPSFDAPGRLGLGRVSDRTPLEYSILTFPEEGFNPRKHVTLPDSMPTADVEWISGVPYGLIEPDPLFSWFAVRRREERPLISHAQVVLPFFDPVTNLEGWQFAFPPQADKKGVECSIQILTTKGKTHVVSHPILNGPFDGQTPTAPPSPLWAWIPVHVKGRIMYAFPQAPRSPERPGILGSLQDRPTNPLITPSGEDRLAIGNPSNYLGFDLSVPHVPDGSYSIRLGPMVLAQADVYDEHVHSIQPNDFARELGLWGCHVARITEVYLRLHKTKQPRPF